MAMQPKAGHSGGMDNQSGDTTPRTAPACDDPETTTSNRDLRRAAHRASIAPPQENC
jgi:hypothetical protein